MAVKSNQPGNAIFRGPVDRDPETINAPVASALQPGVFVTYNGTQFSLATTATERLFILGNRRFYNQGPDTAYEANETGIGYRLEPEDEYSARAAAATYSRGQALTVNGSGQVAAAITGDTVVAHADESREIASAGDRLDIVMSRGYVAP